MKTVLIIIVLIAACIGIGYFGLPILIEKETVGLRSEVQDVKQRLQKVEEFTQMAPLQPDADFQKVIKTVNATYYKVVSLEDSFKKNTSTIDETIEKQKKTAEDAFKKQAEAIERMNKDIQAKIQKITFDATMANIRGHILKARVELAAKNVGTAKNELDLTYEAFEKAKTSASDEHKKVIEELQTTLKKARAEIDADLPVALNRIDLLWHEMSKMLRKT